MSDRSYWRLTDMQTAIRDIRDLLTGKEFSVLHSDRAIRAAFERYLEVLSEASRHVPNDWKAEHADIPWRRVADLGNHVRHAYHRIDLEILWNIYEAELDALDAAVEDLIKRKK